MRWLSAYLPPPPQRGIVAPVGVEVRHELGTQPHPRRRAADGACFLPPPHILQFRPSGLVFVYGVAVFDSYRVLFKRMRLMKIGEPLAGQRLAILLRTCGWIPALRLLSGPAVTRLAGTNGFREAWNKVEQIRLDERQRIEAEAAAERRLIENAGVAGVDESGQQLDSAGIRGDARVIASAGQRPDGPLPEQGEEVSRGSPCGDLSAIWSRTGYPSPMASRYTSAQTARVGMPNAGLLPGDTGDARPAHRRRGSGP